MPKHIRLPQLLMLSTFILLWITASSFILYHNYKPNSAPKEEVQIQKKPQTSNKKKAKIQIALLLDTSNSMDGLIEQAKSQLWNIVNELGKAKCDGQNTIVEIALYEYGNDGLNGVSGFVRKVLPLTTDLDKISTQLFELQTNGGQEYCGTVINRATQQLEWSSNDNDIRMIFIAGNEPFNQGSFSYEKACGNARAKRHYHQYYLLW